MGLHKLYSTTLLTLALSASSLYAQQFLIKYRGITLGEIPTLSTLKDHYLDAKVTNFIAKLLIKKEHFVFYEGEKPLIKDAKFKKDKNKVIFALYEAIVHRPLHKEYAISENKRLVLECYLKECHYVFHKNNKVAGKGKILFDEKNIFYELTEEKSHVVIVRKQ